MARSRKHRLAHLWLLLATSLFALPLVWMVLNSFKTPGEFLSQPNRLLPEQWRLANYADAVRAMPFVRYLQNSLVLCGASVLGTLVSCTLAAYGFARIKWPGRDLMFAVLICTLLLPWQVTMIPRFLLMRELGLYNTLAALILPTFFGDAFFIFLLRQFFLTLPGELSDAARLDGCTEFGIFWRIAVPLARPAIATVALLQFIAVWNDFSGPLLYLRDSSRFPLAYGLEQFVSAHSSETHLLLAGAVLFTLPIMVLFFIAQRTFMKGITAGGIKG